MDFRSPRPENGSGGKLESPQAPPQKELRLKKDTSQTVRHIDTAQRTPREKKSRKTTIAVIVVAAVLLVVVGFFVIRFFSNTTQIEADKYQFIKLSNNEEYYGKLAVIDSNTLQLTDIFYIKSQDDSSTKDDKDKKTTAQDQNNLQLIKLGSEVHGPEDKMIINRSQVMFYINLRPDGKVSQTIDQYNKR